MVDVEPAVRQHVTRAALLVAMLASVGSALATIAGWVNDYVTEDQTLLWAAAESWGDLQPHGPTFWGQTYGTTLEAVPAKLIRGFGVHYATALPLAVAALNLAMWAVLGLALYRRGRPAWAAAAFGAIALLSTEHLVVVATFNTAAGRLLACIAAAIYLRWHPAEWALLLSASISALAVALEPSVVLLAAPLAVYQTTDWWRATRGRRGVGTWARLAAAAIPAGGWLAFTSWWVARHPEQDLHPAPVLAFSWRRLRDNLAHPNRHFGAFTPELVPWVVVIAGALVAVGAVAIQQRSYRRAVAVAALVATCLLALSTPKALDYFDTPMFPAVRIVLAFAPAAWFVAAVEPWPAVPRWHRRVPSAAVWVAVLCVASAGWRAARWDAEVGAQRDRALTEWRYAIAPVTDIERLCIITKSAAETLDVEYAVFQNRTAAYACAATQPMPTTVFPEYERRAWVLREFLESEDLDFVVVGQPPACPPWLECMITWPEVTYVRRPEDLAMDDALWSMAIRIRPPFEDYP